MPVLSDPSVEPGPNVIGTATLFVAAMVGGSTLGLLAPSQADSVADFTDATLLALIFLLFFEIRLAAVARAFGNVRFLAIAWVANFLIVPTVGFAIASFLVSGQDLLFAGLMIYFLAPCTDWFLGFTRMARGDTELGAALIPVNLISQLLLFPVWLWLFTPAMGFVDFAEMPVLLLQWFVIPMVLAQTLRLTLGKALSKAVFSALLDLSGRLTPAVLALLILLIFASHVGDILANAPVFGIVALGVVLFFALTFLAGHALNSVAQLRYEEHTLLAMTMAARNAPLMLALTAVAIPDQPLVLAVIVFGMLIEIPHLTLLRLLLLRRFHAISTSEARHVLRPQ